MAKLSANVFFLLLLGLAALVAQAEMVRTDFANLRAGPAATARVITALPKGAEVILKRQEGDYVEVQVRRTGMMGWLYQPAQGWARPAETRPVNPSPASVPDLAMTPVAQVPAPIEKQTAEIPVAPVHPAVLPVAIQAPPSSGTAASASQVEPPPPLIEAQVIDAANALPMAQGEWTYPLQGGDPKHLEVTDLHLEMDALDARVLFRKDPYDRSEFSVLLRDSAGVHAGKVAVKGNFSRHFLKKSLLITLNKGDEKEGRRRIALNAMATDPSQAREWLAWDLIHRLGLPAPRARFTRLHLNGEFIGLYLDIEWMDAAMFERLGLGAGGALYEPEGEGYCGDLSPASVRDAALCWKKLSPGGEGFSDLKQLAESLAAVSSSEFHVWLAQHFDAQSVIDWLVVNTLTQNGDTYNKNYFLHKAGKDGKWRVIPWDYDLAWGRVADGALPFPRTAYNPFFQYAFPPDLGMENPLKRKLFENPQLYAKYLDRLAEVLGDRVSGAASGKAHVGWYEPQRFRHVLADLAALSRITRAQEKYPAPGSERAETMLESLAFFNEWRSHTLRAQLLEKTVFGTPRWMPMPPATPLSDEAMRQRRHQRMDVSASADLAVRHARLPLIEPLLGWVAGVATLREAEAPVRLTIENAREAAPMRLPPGVRAGQCIERTWFATVKSEAPVTLDLEFDYLHEASTRREVPDGMEESTLQIHWFDGQKWHEPAGHVNGLANFIAVPNVRLQPDVAHRFVACAPPQRP